MESVPSLRFYPSEKAFVKWTKIASLCAANSYILGLLVTDGKFIPMLLGVLTIIYVFAMIESNPRYIAIKEKNNLFQKAINIGIKLRCGYGLLSFICFPVVIFGFPDIYIGWASIYISDVLFGMRPLVPPVDVDPTDYEEFPKFFSNNGESVSFLRVYATTIIDGLLHSIILAFLCGIIYFIMSCLRVRKENE